MDCSCALCRWCSYTQHRAGTVFCRSQIGFRSRMNFCRGAQRRWLRKISGYDNCLFLLSTACPIIMQWSMRYVGRLPDHICQRFGQAASTARGRELPAHPGIASAYFDTRRWPGLEIHDMRHTHSSLLVTIWQWTIIPFVRMLNEAPMVSTAHLVEVLGPLETWAAAQVVRGRWLVNPMIVEP